jgi:multisubunit Na+/H+ antiporter MnhC subunit
MNATKAMTRSRYPIYAAEPARRAPVDPIPHSTAVVAAFAFVSALVVGAI